MKTEIKVALTDSPNPSHAYSAVLDNYEPGDPQGFASSREEAIRNLIEELLS